LLFSEPRTFLWTVALFFTFGWIGAQVDKRSRPQRFLRVDLAIAFGVSEAQLISLLLTDFGLSLLFVQPGTSKARFEKAK